MSNREQRCFDRIANKLINEHPAVSLGRMMSSPGITYHNKVIAFFHQDEMVFRLGKGFDPRAMGVRRYAFLHPHKHRGPMTGWFQVPGVEADKWESLARVALRVMDGELRSTQGAVAR